MTASVQPNLIKVAPIEVVRPTLFEGVASFSSKLHSAACKIANLFKTVLLSPSVLFEGGVWIWCLDDSISYVQLAYQESLHSEGSIISRVVEFAKNIFFSLCYAGSCVIKTISWCIKTAAQAGGCAAINMTKLNLLADLGFTVYYGSSLHSDAEDVLQQIKTDQKIADESPHIERASFSCVERVANFAKNFSYFAFSALSLAAFFTTVAPIFPAMFVSAGAYGAFWGLEYVAGALGEKNIAPLEMSLDANFDQLASKEVMC